MEAFNIIMGILITIFFVKSQSSNELTNLAIAIVLLIIAFFINCAYYFSHDSSV